MRKKKYLPLYYEWLKAGQLKDQGGMDAAGLCYTELADSHLFSLIEPDDKDVFDMPSPAFWGRESDIYACGKFSPLRQNLVLLICAMNGEL